MHLRGVVYRNIQHLTGDLINTLIIDNYNVQKTYIKAQLWMM